MTPPEALQAVSEQKAPEMVPLDAEARARVETQVTQYIDSLVSADVQSDEFKARLDSAFRLGREEVSNAASLMTGRFMERNLVGMENSPAFTAIREMRGHLDQLNPGNDGDLLAPNRLLGIIPWGNKLQAYFRKYQSAGAQIRDALEKVNLARDDMQKDATEIEHVKGKLWEAMLKLKGAIHFSEQLDAKLAARVEALKASDPMRARALEQDVLFYARQNLQDMYTQQAVCVNGYLSLDVLKKTAREMMNGCTRIATTGMSALATAQTVARATGNQIQVMEMLQGVKGSIENLVVSTAKQLEVHVQKTGDFAANPLIGVEKIKEAFDTTFRAMDAMDNFRAKAIETMAKNNDLMKEQIGRAETYLDKVRGQKAREALKDDDISGPVAL
ncbi:MAG: toxic anion resistance protein [Proteobacteria bacterium]|nr:toxic anion resistance protein [Burkholderiales bacterium]